MVGNEEQMPGRWKIIFAVMFLFLFTAELSLLVRQERTQLLASSAQKTAGELTDFAQAHAARMQRDENESIDHCVKKISAENLETQSLYGKLFYGRVSQLRDAFARRGVQDQELDEFYARPVYPIGILEVGSRLSMLADRTR
jgi:hypothetical protein